MTPRKALANALQVLKERASASEGRIESALAPLVRAATDPDEGRRHASVESLSRTCLPAVLNRLCHRLAGLLGGSQSARGRAAASLVQLGRHALPALTDRFRKARSAAVQAAVLGVLAKIGPRLGPADCCDP